MSTLLLRLAAPIQSWGVDSKFDIRGTEREPTKSGVLGLLAAALGIRRDDSDAISKLSKLKFGLRVDRGGKLNRDFHMVHGEKNSYVTHRYYLNDAVFLCGLESDSVEDLQCYIYALTHPVYPLFLGRRSCPPTLPLVIGLRESNLETALKDEPYLVDSPEGIRIEMDAEVGQNAAAIKKDVPKSFSQRRREFGYRKYREIIITEGKQMEHDPFAEVEAENVSDTHET